MLRYQHLIHGLLTIKPGYVDWEMGEFGGRKAKRQGKWEKRQVHAAGANRFAKNRRGIAFFSAVFCVHLSRVFCVKLY